MKPPFRMLGPVRIGLGGPEAEVSSTAAKNALQDLLGRDGPLVPALPAALTRDDHNECVHPYPPVVTIDPVAFAAHVA